MRKTYLKQFLEREQLKRLGHIKSPLYSSRMIQEKTKKLPVSKYDMYPSDMVEGFQTIGRQGWKFIGSNIFDENFESKLNDMVAQKRLKQNSTLDKQKSKRKPGSPKKSTMHLSNLGSPGIKDASPLLNLELPAIS